MKCVSSSLSFPVSAHGEKEHGSGIDFFYTMVKVKGKDIPVTGYGGP
jgi:hypothetical protein